MLIGSSAAIQGGNAVVLLIALAGRLDGPGRPNAWSPSFEHNAQMSWPKALSSCDAYLSSGACL